MKNKNTPTWCPGCGDFAIKEAFEMASRKEKWNNNNTVVTAGIGCHGHMINFINITGFEGLHGRAVPVATGIKLVNNNLNVFVFSGDGDCLAGGRNHLIHAARRNHNLTVILHDNALYGLTTGQTSPASPQGYRSKSTPHGNLDEPLHPLTIAITAGATFAAREYSGNIESLSELIIKANKHDGFSIIEVLQPCVTFNKVYTHGFFQKNIYNLSSKHDKTNKIKALEKSIEWGNNRIPIGIFYEINQPSYENLRLKDTKTPNIKAKTKISRNVASIMRGFM